MTAITIIPATVEHLPWLRVLFGQLVAEQQAAFPRTYPAVGGDDDLDAFTLSVYRSLPMEDAAVFVAESDGRVLGFVGGEILTRTVGLPRRFAHCHYLYVVPDARHAGVAGALIAAGAEWIDSRGCDMLECYGLAGDTSWERRGFHPMLVRYYASVAQLLAGRPAPPPPAKPAASPRRRRKRARPNGHADQIEA